MKWICYFRVSCLIVETDCLVRSASRILRNCICDLKAEKRKKKKRRKRTIPFSLNATLFSALCVSRAVRKIRSAFIMNFCHFIYVREILWSCKVDRYFSFTSQTINWIKVHNILIIFILISFLFCRNWSVHFYFPRSPNIISFFFFLSWSYYQDILERHEQEMNF